MKKIGAINGLRGMAIIAVVYHHLYWKITGPGWHAFDVGGVTVFPFTALSNGWVGVNLFFILSGFVLYLPYAENRRQIGSAKDTWAFFVHRGKRLLPLYYLSVVLSMFFFYDVLHRDADAARNILLMLTATFNFTVDMWFPKYNQLLWSIGVEIWFCFLFPLFVVAARRFGVVRLLAAVAAVSLATRFAGVYFEPHFHVNSIYHNALKDSLAARADDFVVGMLAASLYVTRFRDAPLSRPALALLAGLAILVSGGFIWDYYTFEAVSAYLTPITNNLFQTGFVLVILSLLSMRSGTVLSVFTNRPLQVLGMMCYSVYIWHQQAMFAVIRGQGYTFANLAIFVVVLLVLSGLTYRYVEFGHKPKAELFLLGRPSFD